MKTKKRNFLLDFIRESIFYRVPEDEKNYAKKEVMQSDYIIFKNVLIVIALCQIFMILFRLLSNMNSFETLDKWYLLAYVVLLFTCIVAYPLSLYLVRKNDYKSYFVLVAIVINIILLWGLIVTLLDSSKGYVDLSTYAYVTLAISAFVVLEPWVFIMDSIIFPTELIIAITCFEPYKSNFRAGAIITIISVALLTCMAAVCNFRKRVQSLKFQMENEKLSDNLRVSAFHDDLTNTYNRRFLTEHIDDPIWIGLRPSGAIMFDIDDFKKINDDYGHQNGDIILREISSVALKNISKLDGSYSIRYGGEEFLIFLEHTNKNALVTLAERIRKDIEDKEFPLRDGSTIHVTISVGCAIAEAGFNYSHLISIADDNLYYAKENGKNRVCFKEYNK